MVNRLEEVEECFVYGMSDKEDKNNLKVCVKIVYNKQIVKEKLIKRVTKISNFLLKFHIDLRRVIFKQVLNQLGGKMRFVISRRSSTW